jgi:hypothetical protein
VRKYKECLSYDRLLVGKLEGKRKFGRPRHRLEDNIKLDIQGIGLDLSGSGQREVACCCELCNESLSKFLHQLMHKIFLKGVLKFTLISILFISFNFFSKSYCCGT